MRFFHTQLQAHLDRLNERDNPKPKWTMNLISRRADVPSGHFSLWKKAEEEGGRFPTLAEIEKIASLPDLELSIETLKAWKAIDEYGKDVIRLAGQYIGFEEKLGSQKTRERVEAAKERRNTK